MFQQVLFWSALHLSSLPDAHPLKPHIRRIEKKDVKRHRSALHKLIHTLGVHLERNETILLHAIKPGTRPPFKTYNVENKEMSLEDFRQLRDRTLIFTDGSCTDGLIGASAVLYVDYTHVATLHYHLGSAEHHTVFETEAVGLILAAHLLLTRPETSFPAMILVDNQAVIRSGENLSSPDEDGRRRRAEGWTRDLVWPELATAWIQRLRTTSVDPLRRFRSRGGDRDRDGDGQEQE